MIAVNISDVYHMDLDDMQKFAEYNEGYKYILTVIDCFSRYAMAIPIKSKVPSNTRGFVCGIQGEWHTTENI